MRQQRMAPGALSAPGVALWPIGDVQVGFLSRLAHDLELAFGVPCRVGRNLPLDERTRDPARGQYASPRLLAAMRAVGAPHGERVLGIVDVDLFADGLNFVFGQAEMPGRWAIISLYRLRPKQDSADGLFYERALKEAVHELGHTFGLGHCPDPACVMHFSNTLADTDRKLATLCATCQQRWHSADEKRGSL